MKSLKRCWGLFVLVTACVKNPVTGEPELALLSASDEQRIGREMAEQVETTIGLAGGAELRDHVTRVGSRLAAHSPRQDVDYQFDIVDMAAPNAFALPDGHVYVSRGLLALSNSEDELAGVLGHEIGHVAARHAAQQYTRAAPVGILTGATSAVVGIVSSSAGEAVAGFGGGLNSVILAPYGREQENQADEVGQNIAYESGWNPYALPRILTSLDRMDTLTEGGPHETSWLDSHPATPERVKKTRAHAAQLLAGKQRHDKDRERHLRTLDGLLLGQNQEHGFFDGRQFVHPELHFAVRFPAGWDTASSKVAAGAVAPKGEALLMLTVVGEGTDPMAAAREFARAAEFKYSSGPTPKKVGEADAVEAVVQTEQRIGKFVFVVHEGTLYLFMALTSPAKYSGYAPAFEAWLQSFRKTTAQELADISELRLALVQVVAKEPLEATLRRYADQLSTPSKASLRAIAILNGLGSPNAVVSPGLLKVPVVVPYVPRSEL